MPKPEHGLVAVAALEGVAGDETRLREQIALATEADFRDSARADRVSLLTMHAAKGLEFAVVFVVGMEDGLVPFAWDLLGTAPPRTRTMPRSAACFMSP